MPTEFMGYAKIEEFTNPITVRGHLLAKPVMPTTEDSPSKMQGTGFSLELVPEKDGWRARFLTVHGVRMEGDEPTTVPVLRHFFLSEPKTPLWVRALVAQCTPPQAPPRPARTVFDLENDHVPQLCWNCSGAIVYSMSGRGAWWVHADSGTHLCRDGSGSDCNTRARTRAARKD